MPVYDYSKQVVWTVRTLTLIQTIRYRIHTSNLSYKTAHYRVFKRP